MQAELFETERRRRIKLMLYPIGRMILPRDIESLQV